MTPKRLENPPKLLMCLLRIFVKNHNQSLLLDDLREGYMGVAEEEGQVRASEWYAVQVFKIIKGRIYNKVYWSGPMFANYFKIAFRNIKRNRGYALINIAGLSIGIVCSVFLLLWVQDELGYDRFHENAPQLYRILLDPLGASVTHEAVSPPILARKMMDEFPEVINVTRVASSGKLLFSYGDKKFYENAGLMVDPSFFDMFSFSFLEGDPSTALADIKSIVLTESLAHKYFGSVSPIGKRLTIDNSSEYLVSGVIENVPRNSHLQFEYVRSFNLLKEFGRNLEGWRDVSFYTYVQLVPNSSTTAVDKKLEELVQREDPGHNNYYLQALTRIHLYSNYNFDIAVTGNSIYVYIFVAAALFILLIASINYMNLSTARAGTRALEIGVRKVVGADKKDIRRQFYHESLLITFIAFLFAGVLLYVLLPFYNTITAKQFVLNSSEIVHIVLLLTAVATFLCLVSGSYPALLLSSFSPASIIKHKMKLKASGTLFRKIFVLTQFTLTIILLIGTFVIQKQLTLIRNAQLGYDKELLVCVPLRGDFQTQFETAKNELLNCLNINDVAAASALPTYIGSGTSGADWEGKDPDQRVQMQIVLVDYDYLNTFSMEMKEGRFFSREFSTDTAAVVLNEAAVRAMGMTNPIGKRFTLGSDGHVIGVIKNFHYKSLHIEIEPLILLYNLDYFRYAVLRITPEGINETVAFIEQIWRTYNPDFPFEYFFLDDRIDALYRAEQRVGSIFNYFTILAIFISCLGLLGLTAFTTEQRTKEIGIRKVLGASKANILFLLSQEYLKWIVIANVLAWPIAFLVMRMWLNNFAYKTPISIFIFILSGGMAFIVACITVFYIAFKTARADLVENLRYE